MRDNIIDFRCGTFLRNSQEYFDLKCYFTLIADITT